MTCSLFSAHSNLQHYRPHSRYSHDALSAGSGCVAATDHAHSLASSGFHSSSKSSKLESRSRHSSRHHLSHRSTSHHHHHSNSHHHPNFSDTTPEEEAPVKRPCLMVDVSRKLSGHSDSPSSADSVNSILPSSRHSMETSSPWVSNRIQCV